MSHRDIVRLGNRLISGFVTGSRFIKQGTKFTEDGLSHVILDTNTNRLYRVEIKETTIENELPRLAKSQAVKTEPQNV